MKKFWGNKALRIMLATNAIILLSGAMLAPIYAIFVENVGGDLLDASFAGGAFALAAGITTLVAGRYVDKIKESELIVVAGYLIIGLGFLLYVWVGSVLTLSLVSAFIGFGEALYSPAFDAVYSKHLAKTKAGSQWGAWESTNYFTAFAGAVLGGLLVTYLGFVAMFLIMAALCLGSALYIYFLPRSVL